MTLTIAVFFLLGRFVHTFHAATIKEQVGGYVVIPFSRLGESGQFASSVTIRLGVYDRISRFIPQFASETLANSYALAQARTMVLSNQLN